MFQFFYYIKSGFSISIVLIAINFISCVEPYKMETQTYEEVLVVESTITDELIHQKVKLSTVYRLDSDLPIPLSNAQLSIKDANDVVYNFTESDPGIYLSDSEFKAMPNISYKLFITTEKGKKYESKAELLTAKVPIKELYATLENNTEKKGVHVIVKTSNEKQANTFLRYEYEETYKIITPYSIIQELIITNANSAGGTFKYNIDVVMKEDLNNIGYITNKQLEIIQTSDLEPTNTGIQTLIRFIEEDDPMLRERYSILVKQYTQTYDSYNFYKIIGKLGGIKNVLEENQPGFVSGNLISKNDTKEKVVGFFDVSSIATKRIYFNYSDFNYVKPKYPYTCKIDTLDYMDNTTSDGDRDERSLLYQHCSTKYKWQLIEVLEEISPTIYVLLTPECGDCSYFSQTTKPVFWED